MKDFYLKLTAAVLIIGILSSYAYIPVEAAAIHTIHNSSDTSVLFWVICIVGGCIALTLTYVSWRKYNAEVRKKNEKDNSVD